MTVCFELVEPSIAVVTLDWPEKRNALGPDEARQLRETIEESLLSGEVRGLVLTGNGAFSAGGDLAAISTLAADPGVDVAKVIYKEFQGVVRALLEAPVVTAAAIDGPAVGLGFDLTLACDMRFFGSKGWVMQGWARLGLIPGTGGIRLLQSIAPGILWKMIAEQARIYGPEAQALGLGQIAPGESALIAAVEALVNLGEMGEEALEAYVRMSRQRLQEGFLQHLEECATTQSQLLRGSAFTRKAQELLA
jgi:enoyl-CoA hydratase/carnithine racemase